MYVLQSIVRYKPYMLTCEQLMSVQVGMGGREVRDKGGREGGGGEKRAIRDQNGSRCGRENYILAYGNLVGCKHTALSIIKQTVYDFQDNLGV